MPDTGSKVLSVNVAVASSGAGAEESVFVCVEGAVFECFEA